MSTRCHVVFMDKNRPETEAEQKEALKKPDILLYRHSDGYRSGVLPDLIPFLKDFTAERGADAQYGAAQWLAHVISARNKVYPSYLGYGVCNRNNAWVYQFDIEWCYVVWSNGREFEVQVWETPFPPIQGQDQEDHDNTSLDNITSWRLEHQQSSSRAIPKKYQEE